MNMATLGVPGRSAIFTKLLLCVAVGTAGAIAGRLSIERPSDQATIAPCRDLTDAEKRIIAATVAGNATDVTIANVVWPPLILMSREGNVAFYAQLVFPRNDPRASLDHVNLLVVAAHDDPHARYVVGTACAHYGYGAVTPAAL
jgi:hypothetical protein